MCARVVRPAATDLASNRSAASASRQPSKPVRQRDPLPSSKVAPARFWDRHKIPDKCQDALNHV